MDGSVAELAKRWGISRQGCAKWLKDHGIPVVRHRVNFERADAARAQELNPLQQQRSLHQRTAGSSAPLRPQSPKPNQLPPLASLPAAHLKRELVRLEKETLLLAKLKGSLVDAEQVAAETEARFRADAEALLNWPASIAPEFAAELGLDERQIHALLDKYVRAFMRARSMVAVDTDRGGARA